MLLVEKHWWSHEIDKECLEPRCFYPDASRSALQYGSVSGALRAEMIGELQVLAELIVDSELQHR